MTSDICSKKTLTEDVCEPNFQQIQFLKARLSLFRWDTKMDLALVQVKKKKKINTIPTTKSHVYKQEDDATEVGNRCQDGK